MKPAGSTSSLYSVSPDVPCAISFRVGDQVKKGDLNGRVAFVGTTEFEKGQWIGIILEKPEGKNNGTVKGKTYFKCPDKYGLFCRQNVLTKLGDSPKRGKGLGSPTPSFAGSMAPSIAASQMGKEHSLYAVEYGYDLGQNVTTNDGRVGKVKFLDMLNGQVSVGILFSKPVGDSDGKFQGIKHFSSYPKFATFLPADQAKLASTTNSALPPKTAPRETKASLLRKEKRVDGGTIISSWRGSQESLNSQRSPRSPPPKTGLKRQPNPMKENDMIIGLKKDLQEKVAHLTNMSKELEECRCESVRLAEENCGLRNENRSLKLRVGELDARIEEMGKEIAETQAAYDDRSFCFTEMEVRNEELEMKLNELRAQHLEPLIEMDEEPMIERGEEKICSSEIFTQTEPPEAEMVKPSSSDLGIQVEPVQQFHCFIQTEQPPTIDFGMQCEQQIELKKSTQIVDSIAQTDEEFSLKWMTTSEAQNQTKQQIFAMENGTQTEEALTMKMMDCLMQTEVWPVRPSTIEIIMQTENNEFIKTTTTAIQTDPIPALKPVEKLENSMQTDRHGQSSVQIQTIEETKRQCVETKVQTNAQKMPMMKAVKEAQMERIAVNFVDIEVQTEPMANCNNNPQTLTKTTTMVKREPKESSPSWGGVLELNVMKLPLDASTDHSMPGHLPTEQNSPNTLQRKYDEKCETVKQLEQTTQFLNSIIADQKTQIDELKRSVAEINGNRNSMSQTKKGTPPKAKPKNRRVYCEHCEAFELHDTEGCPKLEAMAAEMLQHSTFSPKKQEY